MTRVLQSLGIALLLVWTATAQEPQPNTSDKKSGESIAAAAEEPRATESKRPLANSADSAQSNGPTTRILSGGNLPQTNSVKDPLLDVPPLPQTDPTLIGGTLDNIDRVRNKISVDVFQGPRMKVFFDERTRFFVNGQETTQAKLKRGDRVYVDTQLDGPRVFARNVRVVSEIVPADARGQVIAWQPDGGQMTLRDEISSQPVTFTVPPDIEIKSSRGETVELSRLQSGSLVAVEFAPDKANRVQARKVTIIATPGDVFTFAGKITHVDMRYGVLAVQNQSDGKTYDMSFDQRSTQITDKLQVGADVRVSASFDGQRYFVRSLDLERASR